MSTVITITDVPADQKDAVVKLHQDAGATVKVTAQNNGLFTIEATYPDSDSTSAASAPPTNGSGASAGPPPTAPSSSTTAGPSPSAPSPAVAPSSASAAAGTQPNSLSPNGAALIKSFENCLKPDGHGNFVPYICPAGVLTIGWGHTNDNGRAFDTSAVWTQQDCDAAFTSDIAHFVAAVSRLVKVLLNQNQFDAVVSFAYNCGETALAGSTLLRKLNASDFAGAAAEFPKWNKGGGKVLPGLVRRRAAEAQLFQSAPAITFARSTDLMPQQVDGAA